ncbi:MAG TPA: hypothetical protein VJX67_14060 [Blastocatellia bacterium]|nr:hypothetical protein [Blastocatellia bacterium]
MSSFPGSPKLMKGAIIGIDPFNPLASVIIFQYNPDTLTRTISAQTTQGKDQSVPSQGEAMRLTGPPKETITLQVEIDATDQLETADPLATSLGVYPTLASLEMLISPKSLVMIANAVLMAAGIIEIIQPEAPLTLFVWGIKRIVPVRLTQFTITEEAFDTSLNPIRAKADLSLDVLTYQDLGLLSVGGALSMVNQVIKEVMATIGGVGNIASVVSGNVKLV